MSPRRFANTAAALYGTVILVACVIATVAGLGLSDIKNPYAPPIEYRATEMGKADAEAVPVAAAVTTTIAKGALSDSSQMLAPETAPVHIATVGTTDLVHSDAKETASSTATLDESSPDPSQMLAPQTAPVQIATVSATDLVHRDAKETVSSTATLDESSMFASGRKPRTIYERGGRGRLCEPVEKQRRQ